MATFPPLGTDPCDHPATYIVPLESGYAVMCGFCDDLLEEVRQP